MSELRITPIQVPISQAKGLDPDGLFGAGEHAQFSPQPSAMPPMTAQMHPERVYSAPATGGALVAAYVIDMALLVAVTALTWWFYPSWLISLIVIAEVWIIGTLIRARSGRTPGAFVMQVAAVSAQATPTSNGLEQDHAPGLARQSAHSLIMLLLHATAIGPIVTWAIPRNGRTWVDRICGTANLDIRASRTSQDAQLFASQVSGIASPLVESDLPGIKNQAFDEAAIARAHQWAGPSAFPELLTAEPQVAPPFSAPIHSLPSSSMPAPTEAPVVSSAVTTTAASASVDIPAQQPVQPAAHPKPQPTVQSQPQTKPQTQAQLQVQPVPPVQAPVAPSVAAPARQSVASALPKVPQAPAPQVSTPQQSGSGSFFTQTRTLTLIVDDGQRIEVNAQIVLGRAPEKTPADARAVAIADSTRSLSRTHLRVAPAEGEMMWVEDTFSANGTRLQAADGSTQSLPRGQRIKVAAGTLLLLGERKLSVSR